MLTTVVAISMITSAPLLLAVTVAVFARDPRRRADARRVVQLLRAGQPSRARRR
ncbi:hypothetical protein [Solihabitans fulvus]|uniref:hypothetical protein n=1 Tax=Solihabitans fulvus TaxID=1892852 RepID=UPI001661BDD8|nr:hypothetical protein [Solihabitans fulvus]